MSLPVWNKLISGHKETGERDREGERPTKSPLPVEPPELSSALGGDSQGINTFRLHSN